MGEWIGKAFGTVFTLIIGTIIGIGGTAWQNNHSSRIRYLDYIHTQYPLVNRPDIVGQNPEIEKQDFKIILKGKPIEGLSQVTITVFNRTDQDFEDIPLYVEITSDAGEPLQMVGANVVGSQNLPEAIIAKGIAPSNTEGVLRYGYRINTANRSDIEPVFVANYFIIGKTLPQIALKTEKKGIQLLDNGQNLRYLPKWWQSEWIILLGVVIFYVAIILATTRITNRWILPKRIEKEKTFLLKNLENELPGKINVMNATPEIVVAFQRVMERHKWESTPKIVRWISGMKPPGM